MIINSNTANWQMLHKIIALLHVQKLTFLHDFEILSGWFLGRAR